MEDVIQVQDQFYILATASKATRTHRRAASTTTRLPCSTTPATSAHSAPASRGCITKGTRYLSRFRLRLNGQRPLLLSARVKDDNELFGADLTNPDMPLGADLVLSARYRAPVSRAISLGRHLARADPALELQPFAGARRR